MSSMSWADVKAHHPLGTEISGFVANIAYFGVWVKYDFDFIGLCLIPEAGIERGKMLADEFSIGEAFTATVIHHNDKGQQLVLSRRA